MLWFVHYNVHVYLILLLQRNRKTSCSLWLRNEALKGELRMSGIENNVSNCESKLELNWPITSDFVFLHYEFSFLVQKVVNDAYKKLFPKQKEVPPNQMFCNLLNISMCQATENNKQVGKMEGAGLSEGVIRIYFYTKKFWKENP